jgi:hypothetical protein
MSQPESVETALSGLSNAQLKRHLSFFAYKNPPTKKPELISALKEQLMQPENLKQIWEQLSPQQQQTVSAIVYETDGLYQPETLYTRLGFVAKLRPDPSLSLIERFQNKSTAPSAFEMLFYPTTTSETAIPSEMLQVLRPMVPALEKPKLRSFDELPSVQDIYNIRMFDEYANSEQLFSIKQADTERAVFHDLAVTLQLIGQGKISVSDRTRQPTLPTVKLLAKQLLLSDYTDTNYTRAEHSIRPFALIMLVQIAKWATLSPSSTSKLELTKRGRALLSTQLEAEHIRELWQAWVKDNSLEPLTRINSIHGLQTRGTRLTKPSQRRQVLEEIVQQLPTGRWVVTQDLFSWIRTMDYDLSVEAFDYYSSLYIGYNFEIGWLGYNHINDWEVLIGSYILVELFEYVSTMGLIEIAYLEKNIVLRPLGDWSMLELTLEDEPFSRYEELFAFRLTNLGRYVLGLTPKYTPPTYSTETNEPMLTVLPNLEVVITNQAARSPLDIAMLERMAVAKSENVYQLQRDLVMESVTNGISLEQLMQFLLAKSAQTSFPPLIQGFFDDVERRLNALREGGRMIVFEGDRYLLAELANLSALRNIVQLATVGERSILLVPEEHETAVRRHIRKRGYIPRKG